MKKILLFALLCVPLLVFATSENMQKKAEGKTGPVWGGGGQLGAYNFGGKTYTRFRLTPELAIWKFGIGLDIDLMIDEDGNLREEDWDDAEDYLNKIYYIRFATKKDPFYAKFGGFNSYTLGRGLIMNEYSNRLRYPEVRQLGLMAGVNIKSLMHLNLEVFSADIEQNKLVAASASFKPLSGMEIPVLKNIKIGATYVTDRDQNEGLLDSDNDNYYDLYDDYPYDDEWHSFVDKQKAEERELWIAQHGNEDGFEDWFNQITRPDNSKSKGEIEDREATVYGFDYDLPIIETDKFTFGNYAELAVIQHHGSGFSFPGFYSSFFMFDANLEFRHYEKDFTPGYFDRIYDLQRAVPVIAADSTTIRYKSDMLPQYAANGWYGSLKANFWDFASLKVSYEDMYYDSDEDDTVETPENGRSLWAVFALKENLIPKLSTAQVSYSQIREEKIFEEFKTENTLIEAKIAYAMAENTSLVYKYQQTFTDKNNDGKIKGNDETNTDFWMGVEFNF